MTIVILTKREGQSIPALKKPKGKYTIFVAKTTKCKCLRSPVQISDNNTAHKMPSEPGALHLREKHPEHNVTNFYIVLLAMFSKNKLG